MITPGDQLRLLALARQAMEARVLRRTRPPTEYGGAFDLPHGAFVTIHCRGELRGCLGRIAADQPLVDTIVDLAASVTDSDPRFAPVDAAELGDIDIEISVLAPEREVQSVSEIEIGRHGVIVEEHGRRGLLLPQVAPEHGWDQEALVAHACVKAALPRDAWRRGARIFVFEAQVFGEQTDMNG